MFLKKIEINGFKSFAKRTTLDFSDGGVFSSGKSIGITAIVGPNGSGKSNVADALRWVMGEQSMKNLRGKKSHDIIFAGSGKKSQLGSAQVSLFFDNSDKKIPIGYEEVVITRKIFRSGESEYLINSSKVRLSDVIDLLAKVGVGQRSYCIINQGMADHILNASALERRGIIEEAAGVKEFQVKKERSERKLKSTKANLERVSGLLLEIEPHLKMLKRQSQRAQKGQQYKEELQQKMYHLFGFLWNNFDKGRKKAQEKKDDFGQQLQINQRKIDELREKISKEAKNTNHIKDEVAKIEDELRQLNVDRNNVERDVIIEEGKMYLEKEKAKNIKEVEFIPVGTEYIKEKLALIKDEQEMLINKIEAVKEIDQVGQLRDYARTILNQTKELYEGFLRGKLEKRKPEEEIKNQRTINLRNIQVIMDKIKELKISKEKLIKKEHDLRLHVEKLLEQDRRERKSVIELEDLFRRKQFELDKLKDCFNDAKIELAKIQVREEDLVLRINQELNLSPDKLEYNGEEVDVAVLEKEINRLKIQIEQIGGIDKTILEEYQETQKRFEFLQKESNDLDEAMKRLKEVVREMDKKIKEKFKDTYEKINKEFNNYFRIIFGGGKAELKMIEIKSVRQEKGEAILAAELPEEANIEGNVLPDELENFQEEDQETEQGIEILACPPGKKISNLGMLSGGERSLTSIGLLFAIISHNPPPFAILDEVEAALDEANSKRFSRILHELSGKTQFVLITHNRQTMREATLLYGVTMGDDGISKLLSVRLDQVGAKGEIKEK